MNLAAWRVGEMLGIPPSPWLTPNTIKIYEYHEVVRPSKIAPDHTILDLGCGKGVSLLNLARRCRRAIGIDTSASQLVVARRLMRNSRLKERTVFLCSRLEEAQLGDAFVDRVFSFSVLEHIHNYPEVLREIHRILRPGGELHMSVDTLASIADEALVLRHKQEHEVQQYFTEPELSALLEGIGFSVLETRPILTSELARAIFEKRIRSGTRQNLASRTLLYWRLKKEEERSSSRAGIMLIARARRVA